MKIFKLSITLATVVSMLIIFSCGDSSTNSSGTVSMSITDAKPLLPEGTTNLWVTFDEVLVHKSGGGWESLPLVETPYIIDLLQFHDGNTTDFIPPVSLGEGKYTQIRFGVTSATIVFNDTEEHTLTIPSNNLKTDKNFTIDVEGSEEIDITIDFDLSKSIVVTNTSGTPKYKLKPVLHIVQTSSAAKIHGSIVNNSFTDSQNAIVTLYEPGTVETYTQLEVSKSGTSDPTEFSIHWLVPGQSYTVTIDLDPESENGPEYDETIDAEDMLPGYTFELNDGSPWEL